MLFSIIIELGGKIAGYETVTVKDLDATFPKGFTNVPELTYELARIVEQLGDSFVMSISLTDADVPIFAAKGIDNHILYNYMLYRLINTLVRLTL